MSAEGESSSPADIAPPAPLPNRPIEVDTSAIEDNDSSYGDELTTYTASLTSSITAYPFEHGRRYHAYSGEKYVLPNDEIENDRLDMVHAMLVKLTGDKLHLAPIGDHPQRILDLGTGTGMWAMEMGDKYPSATVIGNDLSPIQPRDVPPNVRFEVDDIEHPWVHDAPFDYIHCRYLVAAIADWPGLIAQCYKNVQPGGWVEFQDFDLRYYSEDGSLSPTHHTSKWVSSIITASRTSGREPCPGPLLEGWLREAGFINVHHARYPVPVAVWPKNPTLKWIGACNYMQLLEGLEAFSLRLFTKVLGWSVDEMQVLLAFVRQEMKNPRIHAQFDFHVAYGQRPPAESSPDVHAARGAS